MEIYDDGKHHRQCGPACAYRCPEHQSEEDVEAIRGRSCQSGGFHTYLLRNALGSPLAELHSSQIGRASCRERVSLSVIAISLRVNTRTATAYMEQQLRSRR